MRPRTRLLVDYVLMRLPVGPKGQTPQGTEVPERPCNVPAPIVAWEPACPAPQNRKESKNPPTHNPPTHPRASQGHLPVASRPRPLPRVPRSPAGFNRALAVVRPCSGPAHRRAPGRVGAQLEAPPGGQLVVQKAAVRSTSTSSSAVGTGNGQFPLIPAPPTSSDALGGGVGEVQLGQQQKREKTRPPVGRNDERSSANRANNGEMLLCVSAIFSAA